MATIDDYQGIAVFQHLLSINSAHRSTVCDSFPIEAKQKLHFHHDAHIVVAEINKQVNQRAVMCFIVIAWRIIRIRDLIDGGMDSLSLKIVRVQRFYM